MINRLVFNQIDQKEDNNYFFVIMPFRPDWSKKVFGHINNVITSINNDFVCERADDLHNQNILIDIWTSIKRAKYIIADITEENANVFYEIGIAHSLDKNVILISQNKSPKNPFDISIYRTIFYEYSQVGNKKLKKELKDRLENLVGQTSVNPDSFYIEYIKTTNDKLKIKPVNKTNVNIINGIICSFNGVDSYLDFGINSHLLPITIILWFKITFKNAKKWSTILAWNQNVPNYNGIQISINSDAINGKLIGRIGEGGNNVEDIISNKTVDGDSVWHQIALLRSNNSIKMYLDGTLEAARNNLTSILNTENNLFIGRDCGPFVNGKEVYSYFNGEVANVQIFEKVLSGDEIKMTYLKYKEIVESYK
jgi:hypothetical protein